jgi:hypothetical protein
MSIAGSGVFVSHWESAYMRLNPGFSRSWQCSFAILAFPKANGPRPREALSKALENPTAGNSPFGAKTGHSHRIQ